MSRLGTRTKSTYRQGGGTLLEAALALPVLLIFVFAALFLSTLKNSQTALRASVGLARQAFTRGQADLVSLSGSTTPIAALQGWYMSTSSTAPLRWKLLEGLMYKGVEQLDAANHYNQISAQNYGQNAKLLPLHHLYAYAYVAQGMVEAVGEGSVKFPCDPFSANGAGCLSCVSINPPAGLAEDQYLEIDCSYRPANFLLAPLEGLLELTLGQDVTNKFIVRASYKVEG